MKERKINILAIMLSVVSMTLVVGVSFLIYLNYQNLEGTSSDSSTSFTSKYVSEEDSSPDLSLVSEAEKNEEEGSKEGVLEVDGDRQVLGMSKELTEEEKKEIEEEYDIKFVDDVSGGNVYVIETTSESDLDSLEDSDIVDSVEVDAPVKMFADTIDWGISKIGANEVWEDGDGSGVIIAVIDTGIQLNHPDLVSNIVSGYDFTNGDSVADDDNGHGTHVAGIASAMSNGVGTIGAGYSARLMPVKVLNASGYGYLSDVAKGIYFAADNGARVINMSLGSSYDSDILRNAVLYASRKGVLLVAAAGNDYGSPCSYPAAYSSVVCVVATDSNNRLASFSNIGGELAAPGVSNYSTYKGSTYKYLSGTSMASPHVAGAAAVIMSACTDCTTTEVRDILRNNSVDLGEVGQDIIFGYGLVDLVSSINKITEEEIVDEPIEEDDLEDNVPIDDELDTDDREEGNYVNQTITIIEPSLDRNKRYLHETEEDIVVKFALDPISDNSSLELITILLDNKKVYTTNEQLGEYIIKLEDLTNTQYSVKVQAKFLNGTVKQERMIIDLTYLEKFQVDGRGKNKIVLGISTFILGLLGE